MEGEGDGEERLEHTHRLQVILLACHFITPEKSLRSSDHSPVKGWDVETHLCVTHNQLCFSYIVSSTNKNNVYWACQGIISHYIYNDFLLFSHQNIVPHTVNIQFMQHLSIYLQENILHFSL